MSETVLIRLKNGMNTVIDQQDYELVSKYRWHATKSKPFYAVTSINGVPVCLHHLILPKISGLDIDHRDGDSLNNRRNNLRYCTHRQNLLNKSVQKNNKCGFKGVSFHRSSGRFRAQIQVDGRRLTLGHSDNAETAAKIYDEAALRHYGEFARLNFPKSRSDA